MDSQRTRAVRALAPHCEHRLFLSATPHNGYDNSFWALLELLDPHRFARAVRPKPEAVQEVTVRRLKQEGRLLRENAWELCTLFDINFKPAKMSVDELRQGFYDLAGRLYSDSFTKYRRDEFAKWRLGAKACG